MTTTLPKTLPATLHHRRSPLADPSQQIACLNGINLSTLPQGGDFEQTLATQGWSRLTPTDIEIFQMNIGKLCNMTCRHCHVDAGPDRHDQNMDWETMVACLQALDQTTAHTVDITGGAPELNPHFCDLVERCVVRGKQVIDRCNLTVLLSPKLEHLPTWFAERGVEVVCSLPHYRKRNTDNQRGEGTFERSILALSRLNAAGYGQGDPKRRLTLVMNPGGAFLASHQTAVEREWKAALEKNYGVRFDRLIALNNMPIARFLEWLEQSGNLQAYLELLVNSFNPATISGLMCRNTVSIGWDGWIYDCDFNQMLGLQAQASNLKPLHVRDFDPELWKRRTIVTDRHCFGCTAGSGSSCGGALQQQ